MYPDERFEDTTQRSPAYCLFKSLAVHGIRAFLTSPSPLAFAAAVAACVFSRTTTGKKKAETRPVVNDSEEIELTSTCILFTYSHPSPLP
jgi:hypothetical protein